MSHPMTWSSCLGHTQPSLYNSDTSYLLTCLTVSRELCARLSCFIVQERTGPQYTSRSPSEVDTLKERMNEWLDRTCSASYSSLKLFYCRSQDLPAEGGVTFMMLGPYVLLHKVCQKGPGSRRWETWPCCIIVCTSKMNSLNGLEFVTN